MTMKPTALEPEDIQYPAWQVPLLRALIETDQDIAQTRIGEAKAAVYERMKSISDSDSSSKDASGSAEQQAIQDALAILRVLENERRKAS